MTEMRRVDRLMAQRVEVAIVFRNMLGVEDAATYMVANEVPPQVAERVLASPLATRKSTDDTTDA